MQLHFDSEGDGPLVVLLHGFPEDRRTWHRQTPALARAGFRVVAPDLRGYAGSPGPPDIDSYDMRKIAGDVIELIESLGGKCILIGHDFGATTAWFVTMLRPDLVERLAILNIPHPAALSRELKHNRGQRLRMLYALFFQLPVLPELFMRVFGRLLLRLIGPFTREELDGYARAWRGSMRTMLHYYRAMRKTRGELRRLVRPIEQPVLFIWGEREPFIAPEALEGWDEWVPDLRIERIAHARHFVQHDAPERVSQLLVEFAEDPSLRSG